MAIVYSNRLLSLNLILLYGWARGLETDPHPLVQIVPILFE